MTDSKEASPVSSVGESSCPVSSRQSDSRSNTSGSDGMASTSVHQNSSSSRRLHLQVPSRSNSSSSQSSPSGTFASGGRGSSIGSTFSTEQILYRDLSDIQDEFKIVKILCNGRFSKTLLAKPQENGQIVMDKGCNGVSEEITSSSSSTKKKFPAQIKKDNANRKYLVLKAIQSGGLFTDDFKRELRYNYFLSPHPNIVTSFNISFNWASSYNVYVQEYAPFGDLSRALNNQNKKGLMECQVKLVASQIASALEFMHSLKLVHQNIQPENILVFKLNFSRVKLCDFGTTRREATILTKGILLPSSLSHCSYLPPELSYLLPQEKYECRRACDVWQFGILLCVCLTGSPPWVYADFADPVFRQYTNWLKRRSLKLPESFKKFSQRFIRLLKRLLEPKLQFRCEIREVFKYLGDDWVKSSYKGRGSISSTRNSFANKFTTKIQEIRNAVVIHQNINRTLNVNTSGKIDKQDSLFVKDEGERATVEEEGEENPSQRIELWVATATKAVKVVDDKNEN